MPWIQISFVVERDHAPLIQAALETAGALAVTLGDAVNDPQYEPLPDAMPLWRRLMLTALFRDEPKTLTTAQALAQVLGAFVSAAPRIERIEDQVWERAWLDGFAPTRFGRRLWICPRGQSENDSDGVVIELDPGLAFGTGHHPSTALCLRWLDSADLAGRSIIDYGCGSGILAIAALRLGATRAVAVDHDPQALEAARTNAEKNAVADRMLLCLPEDLPDEPVDLVLANILAGPLVELAPRLAAMVRPGGQITLSGILFAQTEEIEDAYRPWFDIDEPVTVDEWSLVYGRRKQPR